jgi:ubiquitin-protein ligase
MFTQKDQSELQERSSSKSINTSSILMTFTFSIFQNMSDTSSAKRLQHDIMEMMTQPHPYFSAEPLPTDIFTWHVNIMGTPKSPYAGTLFHLIMVFPKNYPKSPPNVQLLTPVSRSHVYSTWICLDMLETHHSGEMYSGWSRAYTAYGIILQLSSFLLEEEDEGRLRDYRNKDNEIKFASNFVCQSCPHDMKKNQPWPTIPEWGSSYKKVDQDFYDGTQRILKPLQKQLAEDILQVKCDMSSVELVYMKETKSLTDRHRSSFPGPCDKDGIPLLNSYRKTKQDLELQRQREKVLEKERADLKKRFDFKMVEMNQSIIKIQNDFEKKQKMILDSHGNIEEKELIHVFSKDQKHHVLDLPNDAIFEVMSYLGPRDLSILLSASKQTSKLVHKYGHNFVLSSTVVPSCFYSKKSMKDCTLGIGLVLRVNPHTGLIQYVDSTLDFLSYEAFSTERIVEGVWREPFNHFLPVYLNNSHGQHAIPIFEKCVMKIYGTSKFDPEDAFDLLCKLMNTQVVNVMKGVMHNSSKSLAGYSLFHRWLIYLVTKYRSLQKSIDKKVEAFLTSESGRNKKSVEIIGEFLPLISVSKLGWTDIDIVFLNEICARNVLWALKTNPELGYHITRDHRFKTAFLSGKTMFQLMMYHVYFLKTLAKPKKMTIQGVAAAYDEKFGLPSFVLQDSFQKVVFEIQKVNSWDQILKFVDIPTPSPNVLEEILI